MEMSEVDVEISEWLKDVKVSSSSERRGRSTQTEETVNSVQFDVVKRPVYVDFGGSKTLIPNRVAIVREDTEEVLSVMSNSYTPISNKKVLESFGEIANEASINWYGGKAWNMGGKTIMEIVFPDSKLSLKTPLLNKDNIDMRCYLINSFNGSTAATFKAGFFRLVCSNGMTIGETDMQISYRHIGNINDKIVTEFKNYLHTKIDEVQTFIENISNKKFNSKEEVLIEFNSSDWLGTKAKKELEDEWSRNNYSLNAWVVYNVYTYIISHVVKSNMHSKIIMMNKVNSIANGWAA